VFQGCDARDFEAACDKALAECERFPVPAVLRKLLPKKETTKYIGATCLFHRNNPDKKAQEYDYTCERCNELCRSTWDNVPRESQLTSILKTLSESQSDNGTLSSQPRGSATTAESRQTRGADAKPAKQSTRKG
jgi:hypothetical protein